MNTDNIILHEHLKVERLRIGNTIKEYRELRGYSQEKLGELMNISRTTISKIESGKFNCSIDYLNKFAVFLGFQIDLRQV